jgi:type II secretory pathway pseudopilin PulG
MARSATSRRWAGRCRVPGLGDDAGFTLVEALVSFVVFMVLAAGGTYAFVTCIRLTNVNTTRTTAAGLATQELERLRSQSSADQQLDSAPQTVTLHGMTYTVTPTANPTANGACNVGSTRQVTITVTWNSTSPRSVRYDSALAC